jgi:AcrR family transcriptional regulator
MPTKMKNCPVTRLIKHAYHHGDLRNTLVDEGLKLLEQNGNADFTLRDLARRVGVSPAAPYAHFEDKDSLLAAIAIVGFCKLKDFLEASIAADADPTQRYVHMGEAYVQFGTEHPALYKLMFASEELPAKRSQFPELQEAGAAAFRALTGMLGGMQQSGFLRSGDLDGFGFAVWAHVHGLTSLIITGRVECAGDCTGRGIGSTAEAVRMSLLGMLNGLRNPSAV